MLTKKRKRRLSLTLLLSIIASGIVISLFFILPHYFDVSNYRTTNDFTIDYSEGFSGVNIDFRMSHRIEASFDSMFIFQTISSPNIEEIGITEVVINIYRDGDIIWFDDLDYLEPLIRASRSFIMPNIALDNNISCIGTVTANFNVEGIVEEETFDFILTIIMPVNPFEIRNTHLLNSIWIYSGLGFGLLILVGLIYRTFNNLKHEAKYTEEEIKKDREYFDYIANKLNENKKKIS